MDEEDEDHQSECEDGDDLSTDSDLNEDEDNLNTVTFKCIGVTRDTSYQDHLEAACTLLQQGIEVPVKVVREPHNPFDSRAISFQCELNNNWHVIGYVIKELCDSVHEAITNGNIVSTNFAWVKYKVLQTTGPGYYAAINITRRGHWPPIVHSRSNTMI